jgi:squalene-hopene/tetraprenyl-beta-curcumene cyclase
MLKAIPVLALVLPVLAIGCSGEKSPEGGGKAAAPSGVAAAYDRGLDFLKTEVASDADYTKDPGMRAILATPFFLRPGGVRDADEATVNRWLEYVAGFQKDTGGIFGRGVANYATCASIMALAASGEAKYRETIDKAAKFVKTLQADSGGIGYSDHTTPDDPDLSNTQFAAEALRTAGVKKEDPVYSHMLKFLESVQNRTESNPGGYKLTDGRIIEVGEDGGAYYKPTESKAGYEENRDGSVTPRSYGSMTYSLLKCYLLAGLPADDPRVKDAVGWIENHWTLEENPGFEAMVKKESDPLLAQQGWFYYAMTMAKALDLLGVKQVKDADGLEHDWRKELAAEILSRQNKDGSWKNEQERWFEGMPGLATSYALIALSYCQE